MHQFKQHSISWYHQKLKHRKMKVILLLAAMAATALGEQTCYQGWDMHVRYFYMLGQTSLKNIISNASFYFFVFYTTEDAYRRRPRQMSLLLFCWRKYKAQSRRRYSCLQRKGRVSWFNFLSMILKLAIWWLLLTTQIRRTYNVIFF